MLLLMQCMKEREKKRPLVMVVVGTGSPCTPVGWRGGLSVSCLRGIAPIDDYFSGNAKKLDVHDL